MAVARSWCTCVAVVAASLCACTNAPDAPALDAAVAAPGTPPAPPPTTMTNAADAGPNQAVPDVDAPPSVDASPGIVDPMADAGPTTPDGRPLPTNVSFETAARIAADGSTTLHDELSGSQVDYFVFAAEAGRYYEITTDLHDFSPDNVIEVYDAERNLLGENDNGSIWPGDAVDARVIVRASTSGDCFVRVEDPYTPEGFFASAFPLLYYHLRIRELREGEPGVAREGDGAVTPVTTVLDEETGYAYATLIGETGNGDDVFSIQGGDGIALIARMLHAETAPSSTNEAWLRAQLVDAEQLVLGSVDSDLGQHNLRPPLADAAYELHVSTNDMPFTDAEPGFYAIDIVLIDDNPLEQDEPANDALDGAEEIALEGTALRRGLLLTNLPRGDVDWFRVDVQDGESVTALCESESTGSLVRGLHAELLDADGVVLADATESASELLEILPVPVAAPGTHHLRLSTDATSTEDEGAAWVRCGIAVGR